MAFFENFLNLALESAPWLVLGLILGGLIKNLLPLEFLHKHLSQSSLSSVGKATLLGAPLPLCSCGVVPAAVGLRQAGASRPATVSFLISTPETGVDSLSVTYALLGPVMLVARFISALFSALFSGWLVWWFEKRQWIETDPGHPQEKSESGDCSSSCCSSESAHQTTSSCCSSQSNAAEQSCCGSSCSSESKQAEDTSIWRKTCKGLSYAFGSMLDDIIFWLLLGLGFAALVQTFVPTDFLAQWGSGLAAMLMMLLIGIPMYVCATASTPIAVGLILAGISPGVALVFLLSGPATNIGTLGIIAKILGKKTMLLYLSGTVSAALAAGIILDLILVQSGMNVVTASHLDEHSISIWIQATALFILTLAALNNLKNKFRIAKH
ncbi:SO_0444 family Cu/Zn efflux transporter [Thiomicrorhabdus sp. 6S3-12]|uniref:SO_0444 family Cu/Zn efflux transporter n=1 Tax=Thiomicrorhabdus sp. 6S3-12 TaxID=2819681 RepID=UPI001AAD72FE|nr:SO_0444 family Cu/Zn efflux transporter [Thiomicrorhabdus sp. 6S3-12]MBO1924073.1 SO_0444 family Cu/Zn efflux transporter [Thiomicrorhabdus sp. 6S3-12]